MDNLLHLVCRKNAYHSDSDGVFIVEVGLDSIAANDGAEECVDDDLRGCPEAAMASDVPLPIIAIGAVLWPCFVSDDGWIVDLCFASDDQLILDLDVRDGAERIPTFVVRKMNVPFFVVLPFLVVAPLPGIQVVSLPLLCTLSLLLRLCSVLSVFPHTIGAFLTCIIDLVCLTDDATVPSSLTNLTNSLTHSRGPFIHKTLGRVAATAVVEGEASSPMDSSPSSLRSVSSKKKGKFGK